MKITGIYEFEQNIPDRHELICVWLPKIEKAAGLYVADTKFKTFLVAALKAGAAAAIVDRKICLNDVLNRSGYSKSTFFRKFESYRSFLYKTYKVTAQLSLLVYKESLYQNNFSISEFSDFTVELLYSANCTIPNGIVETLWAENGQIHSEFHDHLNVLPKIMKNYLNSNSQTAHLEICEQELLDIILLFDLDMLNSRIDPNKSFPSINQYKRMRISFLAFLEQFDKRLGPMECEVVQQIQTAC